MDTKVEQMAGPLISEEAINLGKSYLDKLRKKQIALTEFLENMAYMAIQDKYGFNDLRPHLLPTAPYELVEFENLPYEEKKKRRDELYETFKIKKYFEQKQEIELKNISSYKWLCEIRAVIKKKGDPVALNKVQQRIYEFEENAFE